MAEISELLDELRRVTSPNEVARMTGELERFEHKLSDRTEIFSSLSRRLLGVAEERLGPLPEVHEQLERSNHSLVELIRLAYIDGYLCRMNAESPEMLRDI